MGGNQGDVLLNVPLSKRGAVGAAFLIESITYFRKEVKGFMKKDIIKLVFAACNVVVSMIAIIGLIWLFFIKGVI